MERSGTWLRFSFIRLKEFIGELADDKEAFVEFFDRVYDKVGWQEVWETDSRLSPKPGPESLVLQRPDGDVMELSIADPVNLFAKMPIARSVEVMYQMFENPPLLA